MSIIKKIGAFIASRALYLALGIFLATGFAAYATWDQARTTANPGELTETNWNEIVTMIENGITNASNLTTGTVPNARLDADLQDLADGSLSGSKVGAGINGDNITDGSVDSSEIQDNTLTASDLAPNSCGNSEMIDSPTFSSVTASVSFLYSDINLKKDIQVIPNALDKILQLEGVSFEWKDEEKNSGINLGLIAQDVEKIFPELVSTNETTELKSVQYGNLVAPLVEAIKEQQKQIEELKQEIEILKNAVAQNITQLEAIAREKANKK